MKTSWTEFWKTINTESEEFQSWDMRQTIYKWEDYVLDDRNYQPPLPALAQSSPWDM